MAQPTPSSGPAASSSVGASSGGGGGGGGGLALLLADHNQLVIEHVAPHLENADFYSLSCTHRDLANFLLLVQRLCSMTGPHVDTLLAWLSSARGGQKGRQLRQLTHFHFPFRGSMLFDDPLPLPYALVDMLQKGGVVPALRSVDFSGPP